MLEMKKEYEAPWASSYPVQLQQVIAASDGSIQVNRYGLGEEEDC